MNLARPIAVESTTALMRAGAICTVLELTFSAVAFAQTTVAVQATQAESKVEKNTELAPSLQEDMRQMRQLLEQMRQQIKQQEARISQLEAEQSESAASAAAPSEEGSAAASDSSQPAVPVPAIENASILAPATPTSQTQTVTLSTDDRDTLNFWRDTTVNAVVDTYYGLNFNRPLGGINLLRVNDVLSNTFSVNQTGIILERAPKVDEGRRFGARIDLMFGQATESFQGSAVNELRPQVYRHIWQAYGSYVTSLGKGLTVDLGKFASPIGIETNYTKDNFNYSRSYWFNILPFYHLGFRVAYPLNDKFTATYWLVNGINQSEDFNAWKSQAALLTLKPTRRITAQVNYYTGQEGRVRTSILNPTFPILPTQPGLSPDQVQPRPNGRMHIFDLYATFNVTDNLTFALQADNLVDRSFNNSPPSGINGGAAYVRYQFSPGFALAGRFEYVGDHLSDDGVSLFTGQDQALKESTLTAEYKFAEGFLARGEYRRDWSNRPFFLTATPGVLKKEQNTATLGLVWWFGRKQSAW